MMDRKRTQTTLLGKDDRISGSKARGGGWGGGDGSPMGSQGRSSLFRDNLRDKEKKNHLEGKGGRRGSNLRAGGDE